MTSEDAKYILYLKKYEIDKKNITDKIQRAFIHFLQTGYQNYKIKNPYYYILLGCHYLDIDNDLDAHNAFLKAKNYGSIDAYLFLADYYLKIDNKAEFITHVMYLIKKNMSSGYLKLGEYYETININKKLMLKYYNAAIEMKNTHAMYKLGKYLVNMESSSDIELGEKYLEMAIENNNVDAIWYFIDYKQKKTVEYDIIPLIKKVIDSGDDTICIKLCEYYLKIEDKTNLIKYCNLAIKKSHFEAYNILGRYYYYHDLLNLAEENFLLAISNNNYDEFDKAESILVEKQDFNKLKDIYKKYINNLKIDIEFVCSKDIMVPEYIRTKLDLLYYKLGEIYNKSNIKEKQLKSINLFLQIQNKSDELLFTISSIYYYKLKDATNALKYLDLIKINNDKSYFLRGYIYQFDNCNKELMKKNYLKAIELNHFIAMNNLGFSYFNKKKYDKALKYYKMSDEYCYSTATINIGDVYYTLSNFELMKEYYLKFANYEKTTQEDILYFVNKLKKTKTELLFLYDICIRFKIKDPFIEREGQLIKNKLKIINKFDICPICFDELPLIIYECFGHFYCVNCIYKINKCSLCLFVPTK